MKSGVLAGAWPDRSGTLDGLPGGASARRPPPPRCAPPVARRSRLTQHLDQEGRASDAALTVDPAGLVTAVAPGTGDVQAVVGTLASERVAFSILTPADTLILAVDSVLVVPADADPPVNATLAVRLESLDPPGPASARPVIFEITRPAAAAAPVVQLTGGVRSDTLDTGTDGTATVGLSLVAGQVPPDTAIVEVRANRTDGSPIPGSGQRFIALFQ